MSVDVPTSFNRRETRPVVLGDHANALFLVLERQSVFFMMLLFFVLQDS